MIAQLTGTVVEKEDRALVVDVGGVGYQVVVLKAHKEKIKMGQNVTLRIYHHVGEDSETLYGFADKEHLQYFKLLLTVPSVGPRTAMNILEIASPKVLEQAVAEEDTALLTKVSGVGKKTAERIVVELKAKIASPKISVLPGSLQQETVEALVSIGFTPAQARTAVGKLPRSIRTVEEAVRAALQHQKTK